MASTTCKRSTPKGDQPELLHRLCPRHLEKIRGVHTTAVAYSHEGQLLATYGEEDIYLFDYQSRRPRTLKG